MLSSPSHCLRTARGALRPEPTRVLRRTYSISSCRAASSSYPKSTLSLKNRPSSSATTKPNGPSFRSALLIRPVSSASSFSHTATSSSSASNPANNAAAPDERLDWNTFFKLRKSRRRYNLVASVCTSAGTIVGGLFVLAQQDLDPMSMTIFGLDPMLVFGLTIAGFGTIGWLIGPFLGNAVFRMLNSRFNEQMTVKEKEFYNRIKRYRVDPSSQSLSNPVPDYYGEKVSSVAGYRQWMKDQRAYNKKRQSFL